jgi:hypothetical protein
MKKSKLKNPILIDDLADLAKLSTLKEWKTAERMAFNRIQYQKDHIVALPEKSPYLAIEKAFDRGLIAGITMIIKNINNAAAEMEKLAEKEKD